MALTPKQERFVKEYIIDLNATQAAIRAGYSEKRASEIGYQQLHKTTVSSAIKELMDKRKEAVSITAQDVIESIIRISGKAEDAEKFSDALRANELLGKHIGMFDNKQKGDDATDWNAICRAMAQAVARS